MPEPLLSLAAVEAGYPGKQILFGVDLVIDVGEVVALLGANGSGKSTALNTVSGFVRPSAGSIRLAGAEIAGETPHRIFRRGVVQVSQGRDLFPDMTVEDNLRLGAWVRPAVSDATLAAVYESFPRLAERRRQQAGLMSGGEQQMVAIGRALMAEPKLLLLDEPSGGLAPAFVEEIAAIMRGLKRRGITMMLVEQNLKFARAVADRFLILRDGRVAQHHDIRDGGVSEEEIIRSIYL
jgi:branched-chain amino acid transport system ATP-binding protein